LALRVCDAPQTPIQRPSRSIRDSCTKAPDIRKSYRDVGGAFNEINSNPMPCYLMGLEYDTASSLEVLRRCLNV
jgi:hypothetical protein